jgi:hypothetical protein
MIILLIHKNPKYLSPPASLQGGKALDFAGWREVILKIKNKEHLHPKGLEHIKRIKERLN